jgi:esterase/lipase
LISPNFGPRDGRAQLLTWPWGRAITRAVVGPERGFTPLNEAHQRYWTTRYPSQALVEMMALVDLAREVELGDVTTPALLVASRGDRVVDPEASEARFRDLGAPLKELVWFEESQDPAQHVLAGDVLSPSSTGPLVETVLGFVERLPQR